ncbi:MAG: ribose 5-phosphate isomerase B [Elusimicrobia bacterium]|nr:ribose 5-phosphate isomerase B [Elusimicrobiota bacterium]
MIIAFGCDHGGWNLKGGLLKFLKKNDVSVIDFGSHDNTTSVDYPDYAKKVVGAVTSKKAELGILCCGTGIGMSIAANKMRGVRAAVVWNERAAQATREHNAANILCLGGRMMGPQKAVRILKTFLSSSPSPERRHRRRVAKISSLENMKW